MYTPYFMVLPGKLLGWRAQAPVVEVPIATIIVNHASYDAITKSYDRTCRTETATFRLVR